MKKIIYVFIALFILFPCITNAATELSASTQNPVVGNYVYVQLEANYGTEYKIGDFHVYVEYDTNYFSLEDIIWVKFGNDKGTTNTEEGRVYVDKENGNWESGPIVQLKLKVLKEGFSEIDVITNGDSHYTDSNLIAQTTVGISINASPPSNDTLIGSLYVEGYNMLPTFSKTTYSYNLTVPSSVSSVNIVATKGDNNQTITGTGKKNLEYGLNRVRVVVSAQDKSSRTYEIMITRTDNRTGDTSLKRISVSNTDISYIKNQNVYSAKVSKSVNTVMITALANDSNATVSGTGQKKLEIGLNTFEVKVKTSGGKEEIYTLNITRSNEELQTVKKSSKLSSLKVNSLVLDLSSDKTTFLYGVSKDCLSLLIDPLTESSSATIDITGNENLKSGINIITIKVTEIIDSTTDPITEEITEYKLIVYKYPKDATLIKDLSSITGTENYTYNTTSSTNNIISKDILEILKNNNVKLYYNVVNITNGLLSQVVLSNNLPNEDIDVTITKISTVPLTYQINVPEGTEITLYLEETYSNGTSVKIYSYDETGQYTLVTDGIKVNEGYITFKTNNQQNYVITTNDLIEEQSELNKILNKYKSIIIGVIIGIILIIIIGNIISKKDKLKDSNEPLY